MKNTGIYRRVDALGRFVLPKELRKSLDIEENDVLEIMMEGDTIILRKPQIRCALCDSTESLIDFRNKKICGKCVAFISSGQL